MKRGDIVIAAERSRPGGKPRPWLVIQSDAFVPHHATVTLCMISTSASSADLFRVPIEPSATNGLAQPSLILADVMLSVARRSIGAVIGEADATTMSAVDVALRRWLDL